MPDPTLKKRLTDGEFILAPGIYDMISALIADQMGFKALYVTGYGTVASTLGIPDAGIATYRDMIERIAFDRVVPARFTDADFDPKNPDYAF